MRYLSSLRNLAASAEPRARNWPITFSIILIAEVFVADLVFPLGLAVWLPYAALVLIALWVPYRHFTLIVAVACTALLLLAGYLSPAPAPGITTSQLLFNRGLGVLVIWVTALLCMQRKRSEAAVREGEERYRELFENANDVLYTHDLDGTFTSLNRAGEAITGYTRGEALNKMNITEVVAPEYRELVHQVIGRKLAGGQSRRYALEIITKDGRRVALEVSSRLIHRDGRPVGVQGIARDVTERRRLETQLREAQRLEALGCLAGGVAHDFNNLLHGIIGFADLALQELPEGSTGHQYLTRVPWLGRQAGDLIRQLLAFARKAPLERKPLDLNLLIRETAKLLKRTLPETTIIKVDLPQEALLVEADLAQIQQTLLNLSTNARDAMPQGGTLTLRLSSVTFTEGELNGHPERRPGAFARLTVADTGIGIPPAIRDRIFDPFFTTKDAGQGTGLGLASVHGAVHQHEGWIEVETVEGHGSTFHLFLHLLPRRVPKAPEPSAPLQTGDEILLLVEDDPVVRELGRISLTQLGYTVHTAQDGTEALATFRAHPRIALVCTDAIMPRMGAKELVPALREIDPGLKVLVASGYAPEEVRASLRHLNINGFLQKPMRKADLAAAVRAALDGNEARPASPVESLMR